MSFEQRERRFLEPADLQVIGGCYCTAIANAMFVPLAKWEAFLAQYDAEALFLTDEEREQRTDPALGVLRGRATLEAFVEFRRKLEEIGSANENR
jgi:hypothetical protein